MKERESELKYHADRSLTDSELAFVVKTLQATEPKNRSIWQWQLLRACTELQDRRMGLVECGP